MRVRLQHVSTLMTVPNFSGNFCILTPLSKSFVFLAQVSVYLHMSACLPHHPDWSNRVHTTLDTNDDKFAVTCVVSSVYLALVLFSLLLQHVATEGLEDYSLSLNLTMQRQPCSLTRHCSLYLTAKLSSESRTLRQALVIESETATPYFIMHTIQSYGMLALTFTASEKRSANEPYCSDDRIL